MTTERERIEDLVAELAEPYGEWSALNPEKAVEFVLRERQAVREPLEARIRALEAEVARLIDDAGKDATKLGEQETLLRVVGSALHRLEGRYDTLHEAAAWLSTDRANTDAAANLENVLAALKETDS